MIYSEGTHKKETKNTRKGMRPKDKGIPKQWEQQQWIINYKTVSSSPVFSVHGRSDGADVCRGVDVCPVLFLLSIPLFHDNILHTIHFPGLFPENDCFKKNRNRLQIISVSYRSRAAQAAVGVAIIA
jgi:hypothetical protein